MNPIKKELLDKANSGLWLYLQTLPEDLQPFIEIDEIKEAITNYLNQKKNVKDFKDNHDDLDDIPF